MSISSFSSDSSGPRRDDNHALTPGLYLVATPIGNLEDITLRALRILRSVDLLACEDTRTTARLLSRYDLRPPKTSYHDHNAEQMRDHLLLALERGKSVALVSDAGTPLISDPGYKLVRACLQRDIAVFPIPGPSAVLAALSAAGLPSDRFLFAGFVPSSPKARETWLRELINVRATLVIMDSPKRLAKSLADMTRLLGHRQAAVMREMTKLHEEARRGTLAELARYYVASSPPKGEVTLVVGPPAETPLTDGDIDAMILAALKRLSLRDAAAEVATVTGRAKTVIYRRALSLSGRS